MRTQCKTGCVFDNWYSC